MSTINFGNQDTLTSKELTAIRKHEFELHCLSMQLLQLSADGKSFSGPGAIRQNADGLLEFTLYAKEVVSPKEILAEITEMMSLPIGAIIPTDAYYRLKAIDSRGREWISNQVIPSKNTAVNGTVCSGDLHEIRSSSERRDPASNDFLYLEIFEDIKIPFNERTVINKAVAGKESVSSSLNILKIDTEDYDFTVQKEDNSLQITTRSKGMKFVDHIDLRVIEAFQFVLARPISWSVMIRGSASNRTTYIRTFRSDALRARTNPPIRLEVDEVDAICELFEKYLEHILPFEGDKLHPISAQMRTICRASTGAVETEALVLSVAVESILKHVHESKYQLSSEERNWLKKARGFFASWEGPENLSKRITGLFSILSNPSGSIRLSELVELSVINNEQKQAWQAIRNKLAHGETLGSSLQEFLDLTNAVLVLFYHLVFYAIGYRGAYTDYSTPGWPTREYRVAEKTET